MPNGKRQRMSSDSSPSNPPISSSTTTTTNTTPKKQSIAAVTGASGFIGSHLCQNLLEHGYLVRACVRKYVPSKVDHLLELTNLSAVKEAGGVLEICVADMSIPGAYDDIFGNGCDYIFHVAGNFGTDYHLWKEKGENTCDENYNKGRPPPIESLFYEIQKDTSPDQQPQQQKKVYSYDHAVYESYVVAMKYILESIGKNKDTLRRVIYTSSGAAGGVVSGPPIADDKDILENAYGRAKHDCEAMLYDFCKHQCQDNSLIGVSICPCIVMGPMMGQPPLHDTVYPHRLSDMLRGRYTLRQHWDITDVRDVAETHRLVAEATNATNGTRFWNGHEPSWWISTMLEYLTNHDKFNNETRMAPIFVEKDESGSESEIGSESESEDGSKSGSETSKGKTNDSSINEKDQEDDADSGADSDAEDHSGSESSSSSEDSFGISEWNLDEPTTTWSDPVLFFKNAGYKPRTPQETAIDTTIAILERWDALGRDLTIKECSNYYTVAEMDGCDEEMDWLANEIRTKSITK